MEWPFTGMVETCTSAGGLTYKKKATQSTATLPTQMCIKGHHSPKTLTLSHLQKMTSQGLAAP